MLKKIGLSALLLTVLFPTAAFAADGDSALNAMGLNALWVMLAAILVILMQGGFIMLETGSTRMKNAGHVAGKTIFTFGLCAVVYWAVGYGLAFGPGNSFFGEDLFFFSPALFVSGDAALPDTLFFLFQFAFAAVSLSIAWGGFAERAKLSAYLIFTVLFTALVYPVVSHWIWSADGWLFTEGKQDFAGSTVVHLTGAMAALAATLLLKPRIGKFNRNGSANQIHGHNQVYTALGVLLLWVGWFGFNAGSTLGVGDGFFGYVAFNTQLAAGAAAIAALLVAWAITGKADVVTMLNGALAGLVAITASCAFVEPWAAVLIGIIAGVAVFFSMKMFEKLRIDDPISALSVHGVAGILGTLANGFFAAPDQVERVAVGKTGLFYGGGAHQLLVQLEGIVAVGLYAFVVSFVILYIVKKAIGIRVTEEEEVIGLDLSEHGVYGYPEQIKQASHRLEA